MPSRHSSSSHSSSSRSSSSFSSSSSSRSSFSSSSFSRPSSHSSSSHTGYSSSNSYKTSNNNRRYNNYNNNYYYNNGFRRTYRQRYNQPVGYGSWLFWNRRPRPITYYCVNHNYIYYPTSWTSNGRTYQAGYYDETGKYYEKKPFSEKEAGKIYTQCPKCGYVASYDYMDFNELENCPTCGTKMQIADDEDIFISQEETKSGNSFWKVFGFVTLVIVCPLLIFGLLFNSFRTTYNNNNNNVVVQPSNSGFVYGKPIYLTKNSDNTYSLSSSSTGKKLEYVASEDSYYDAENDFWLWYSKEYGVWQYWYEPISSNFGEYGWMEHDYDGWWIEAADRNWIKVPSNFDTSKLYYIR